MLLELCGSTLWKCDRLCRLLCWSDMDHERNEFSFAESLRKKVPIHHHVSSVHIPRHLDIFLLMYSTKLYLF